MMIDGPDNKDRAYNSLLDIFKQYEHKKITFCRDLKGVLFDAEKHDFKEEHEISILDARYDVVVLGPYENVEIFVSQRRDYSDLYQGYGHL